MIILIVKGSIWQLKITNKPMKASIKACRSGTVS